MLSLLCKPVRFFLATAIVSVGTTRAQAIVHGEDVRPETYRFIVSLVKTTTKPGLEREGHTCAGSLVAKNWVLTAAQCVFMGGRVDAFLAFDAGLDGDRIETDAPVFHPNFNPITGDSDLALVKLKRPPREDVKAEIIALAAEVDASLPTKILGWGRSSSWFPAPNSFLARKLQQLDFKIFGANECSSLHNNARRTYLDRLLTSWRLDQQGKAKFANRLKTEEIRALPEGAFCAGTDQMSAGLSAWRLPFQIPLTSPGPCTDDAGGPALAIQDGIPVQVGIISFGWAYFVQSKDRCDGQTLPAFYTSVPTYRSWIMQALSEASMRP